MTEELHNQWEHFQILVKDLGKYPVKEFKCLPSLKLMYNHYIQLAIHYSEALVVLFDILRTEQIDEAHWSRDSQDHMKDSAALLKLIYRISKGNITMI